MYMVLLLFKHFVVWKCDFLHMTCLKMTEAAELPEIATFFWAQQRRKAYSVRAVVNTPKKPRTAGGQSAWYFFVFFFKVLPDLPLPDLAMIHHARVYVDLALSFFDRLCKLPFGSLWNGSHSHDRFNNNVSNVTWRMCASAREDWRCL